MGESGVVESQRDEEVSSYPDVVNYLLRTFGTSEVIAEAFVEVTNFIKRSAITEREYGDWLWKKALRCGNECSDNRLKSLIGEGLLPAIRARVRHHLIMHPRVSLIEVARIAERFRLACRGGRKCLALGWGRDRPTIREGRP